MEFLRILLDFYFCISSNMVNYLCFAFVVFVRSSSLWVSRCLQFNKTVLQRGSVGRPSSQLRDDCCLVFGRKWKNDNWLGPALLGGGGRRSSIWQKSPATTAHEVICWVGNELSKWLKSWENWITYLIETDTGLICFVMFLAYEEN